MKSFAKLMVGLIACMIALTGLGMAGTTTVLTGTITSSMSITANSASITLAGFAPGATATAAVGFTPVMNIPAKVTVSSSDAGIMKGSGVGLTAPLQGSFDSTFTSLATAQTSPSYSVSESGLSKNFNVKQTVDSNPVAGAYTNTLTFSIAAA